MPHRDPDSVLADLDPEQREVATALPGPVCVLAGAGTGKTRAITHRIAYAVLSGQADARAVLAVTFTTRAAGEMRGRLRALGVGGVQARTFHSAALRQLQYFWPKAVGGALPRIAETKIPLLAEAFGRSGLRGERALLRDTAAEIEWAKVSGVGADDYGVRAAAAGRDPGGGVDLPSVAKVYAAYEQVKTDRGAIDFEDVLLLTAGVLDDRPDIADQVRAQYRHFVVDEYQDVNPLQQRLLDLWLGGRPDLCVVGDPAQTIYSFTGASASYLRDFPARYPGARVVRLVRDYRSTPQVVALANRLVAGSVAAGGAVELVAQRPAGPAAEFAEFADETAEAEGIAAAAARLAADGVPLREIAVLFRTNAQSAAFEQAMADKGVPFVLRGAERFYERPEVREAMRLLRGAAVAAGGADDASPPVPAQARAVLAGLGWGPEPPAGAGATRERWDSWQALLRLVDEIVAHDPAATLATVTAELAERAATQHVPALEGVTLATMHAAKGLEWQAVFLAGLTDGLLPIAMATTAEAVEEERRLLYVGITRARERLVLSWSRARTPGGRANRSPSRFLEGLHPRLAASTASGPSGPSGHRRRGGGVARCRICRTPLHTPAEQKLGRCVTCPAEIDEALLERLKQWRLETSRELNVPAFVVFTDATLIAVAERRPTAPAELLAIAGVGPSKLDRYGSAVLEMCAEAAEMRHSAAAAGNESAPPR